MQPGQLLNNRYRIEKPLSAGGFGQTFLAIDTNLPSQPQVVVKLLKPQQSDPATLQIAQRLFNNEAQALEKLGRDSDRIPSLYAYFESGGEFYLVQEFIAGTTLTQELQGQKMSESDTLAILKEILTGLSTVHSQNIIHRDLKPDNIIRRDLDRKLVLIDFGAVKQIRAANATTPNTIISQTIGIGTPGYMPTEQGMGSPKLASDVYAAGAIAVQCLTGSHPYALFDNDTLQLEWQHLCQVNRDVATVIDRLLAPDYRQRYANATEALGAIDSLISPPIPPQAPPQPSPAPSPSVTQVANSPVARSSPAPTVKTPVNQRVKTVLKGIDRRNFFKWLGFGGVGVVSVLAIGQIGKNSSDSSDSPSALPPAPRPEYDPPLPGQSDPEPLPTNRPKLTKIQVTSVKLDNKSNVINKPSGSAEIFTESLGNNVELTMVKISAGKFLMGSPTSEKGRSNDESPQHLVNVPEFYLGQTLVTQSQWTAIMGNNPSQFRGNDKLPVDTVSWLDAIDFCEKLSKKTGRTYRLPSEAEWEYACRAGTNTSFAFGEAITLDVVNYRPLILPGQADRSRSKTTPVGTFSSNLFGLYDLHGNLWEWCLDEWVDSYNGAPNDGSARGDINSRDKNKDRLLRGGAWNNSASICRSASRIVYTASFRGYSVGLRVVSVPSRTS
jgi:eukaryotic-like serine/threonine-protein kinase